MHAISRPFARCGIRAGAPQRAYRIWYASGRILLWRRSSPVCFVGARERQNFGGRALPVCGPGTSAKEQWHWQAGSLGKSLSPVL